MRSIGERGRRFRDRQVTLLGVLFAEHDVDTARARRGPALPSASTSTLDTTVMRSSSSAHDGAAVLWLVLGNGVR